MLASETSHGALLATILAKLPADLTVVSNSIAAINAATWVNFRKWTNFFVSAGVDVGAVVGSHGAIGFSNLAQKLVGLPTVGEAAADAVISDPKTASNFALIYWFQSLIEEVKEAAAPIYAARADRCLIEFHRGTVVGPQGGASSATPGSWAAKFTWRIPGALTARKVARGVLDDFMRKIKIVPIGCQPLAGLAEILGNASFDNRVLWRLAYARFAEHRFGKRFALQALVTIAADIPAFHDPNIGQAVFTAGAVSGPEATPGYTTDVIADFATEVVAI